MASQTTGIQLLLAAEKKAAEKVSEARKSRCIYYLGLAHVISHYSTQINNLMIDLWRILMEGQKPLRLYPAKSCRNKVVYSKK